MVWNLFIFISSIQGHFLNISSLNRLTEIVHFCFAEHISRLNDEIADNMLRYDSKNNRCPKVLLYPYHQ